MITAMITFHFLQLLLAFCIFSKVHGLTTLSANRDPRILARRIKSSGVEKAMELIKFAEGSSADAPFVEALYVCGKARRYDLALKVYSLNRTERLRSVTISVLGTST